MSVEYKTRRRASNPRKGDKVWVEGKIPDNPHAQGANGIIARINWQEREVIIIFNPSRQETMSFEDIRNCWCDGLNSYIIEEEYVHKNSDSDGNAFESNDRDSTREE